MTITLPNYHMIVGHCNNPVLATPTIVDHSFVKTVRKCQILLDSDKASCEINSQPGECFNERHKLFLRSVTTSENTN